MAEHTVGVIAELTGISIRTPCTTCDAASRPCSTSRRNTADTRYIHDAIIANSERAAAGQPATG
jgi:hypothetical protein